MKRLLLCLLALSLGYWYGKRSIKKYVPNKALSRSDFLRLPMETRRAILERQAESAKEYYATLQDD